MIDLTKEIEKENICKIVLIASKPLCLVMFFCRGRSIAVFDGNYLFKYIAMFLIDFRIVKFIFKNI